jgi:hypothetical protein
LPYLINRNTRAGHLAREEREEKALKLCELCALCGLNNNKTADSPPGKPAVHQQSVFTPFICG